ncbi:MAG TPA: methyltransferase [Myxococcota bacterium]|nr:methyltransferase [Myxococcota bacterium]
MLPHHRSLQQLGQALRRLGYLPRPVAQSLGILAWNGPQMDGEWWERPVSGSRPIEQLVRFFIRGEPAEREAIFRLLPELEGQGLTEELPGERLQAAGTLLPLEEDLIWGDRGDRAFSIKNALFLPDSTTLAMRRFLPRTRVRRHLDLGSGSGAVGARAARSAEEVVALDLNPRAVEGCDLTAALSGLDNLHSHTAALAEAGTFGSFDRISFVLPLLMPWVGQQVADIHPHAATPHLLAELVDLLPVLLAPGGLALFYAQDWAGDESVEARLRHAFGTRAVSGAFCWDYQGQSVHGPLRSGIFAVRADRGPHWAEAPNQLPALGNEDWWPTMAALLGEAESSA